MAGAIDERFLDSSDEHEETSPTASTSPPTRPSIEGEMLKIPWYHPNTTRHQAEAELQLAEEGVYLLRPRFDKHNGDVVGYSVDIRCSRTVKHYRIFVNNGWITFGQETFADIEAFMKHFDNCPVVGDDDGKLILCQYPYPRDVDELHDYNIVTTHFLAETNSRVSPGCCARHRKERPGNQQLRARRSYSLASKEGYLTKMGAVVKTWKRRWFVLRNEEFSYYAKEKDSEPIRALKIKEVTEVASCEVPNRKNVFRVVLPWRTFYLEASCPEVREDWIQILQWKMRELESTKDDERLASS